MALNDDELNRRREERKKDKALMDSQWRMLKWGAIMTAVVLVLCGAALLITNIVVGSRPDETPQLDTPPVTEPAAPTEPPVTTEPKPEIPDTVIHFLAGGDVNVTDKILSAGQSVSGYDFSQMFLDLAGVLSGSQLTSVNFEGNLYGTTYGSATACAPPQLMTALRNAGVDLVQTANSYTNYNGVLGMSATLDGIRNAGMEPVGSFADQAEADRTRGFIIREVNGIKLAIVAFTKGMGLGLPEDSENCVNLLYTDYSTTYQNVDKERINKILKNISYEKPDVTIALVHWGSAQFDSISKTQETIRDLLLAGGVDAIIGTHPQYVQKINQDSQGRVVAYSLGVLMGDETNYSVLLDLEITKDGETGEVSISGYDYVPVFYADERETGGTVRLLRIREAITAYENNFVDKVSAETYEAMKTALERIEARVNG